MQVSYELKFHLLRWTKKTNFDLSSSGICSRVWRTSSCPPSLPGNIGSELESTSRTCYGEEVKKVLSMITGTHLVCDCARLMIYEDLLGDVHSVSIFEISNLLMILWSECFDKTGSCPTSSEYSSTMKALGSQTRPAKLVATVSSFNTSNPSILPLSGDM